MLKLTHRYAAAMLDYAKEEGLELIYRQALVQVVSGKVAEDAPAELARFLQQIPGAEAEDVLHRFLDLARKEMAVLEAEIISAVPLTDQQVAKIEKNLIREFRKQMEITTTVDPALLGGLRIIVDNTVIDESIKRQLADMKRKIYEGVYFTQ